MHDVEKQCPCPSSACTASLDALVSFIVSDQHNETRATPASHLLPVPALQQTSWLVPVPVPRLMLCQVCESASARCFQEEAPESSGEQVIPAPLEGPPQCLQVECEEVLLSLKVSVSIHSNQKAWMNAEVYSLLQTRDSAFWDGDITTISTARTNLTIGIKSIKHTYALKVQGHFSSNDPRSMWKGIKHIADYKKRDSSDPNLHDALNNSCFENLNTTTHTKFTLLPDEPVCSVTAAEVRSTLQQVIPRKATRPDGISGRVLKDCAHQLTEILTVSLYLYFSYNPRH